ncbi:flagellar biosynthesis anti-sigma factor FlgM [Halobacillus mangrovi]|uniref:Negative regulator of flagellin synthesis n=1 Tax=Halobacillus mangrovi TaxID=402384 RepID=A0A1W5ZTB4_9BACI|nr:flagellar biosynthesis anti-sigma factor FlgM [Halobacillus mangrovi]ARI76519.1 flagellar biosynthesis anti-sigma factor FlgM [Halobacillus mangrovi]
MKINGPNHSQFNHYQKQMNKHIDAKPLTEQQDKIEISQHAKQMQQAEKLDPARQKRVDQIKHELNTGNYQVDPKATAKKMINFWSNKG